jgi:hypothetical protein
LIKQKKFRKCEEDEIARLVGTELIQKAEVSQHQFGELTIFCLQELREEYTNFLEIYQEVLEEHSVKKAKEQIQESLKKNSAILSHGDKFFNQELSFFISNLKKKAIDSGLEEDSLIPNSNDNDRRIFEYINNNVLY